MSAPIYDLEDAKGKVLQAIQEAQAAGEDPPGRPTLIKITGLTEHVVRKAQEAIKGDAGVGESPASSNEPPAADDNGPDTAEIPAVSDQGPANDSDAGDIDLQPSTAGEPTETSSQQPLQPAAPVRRHRPWPLLLIGLGAAVAVWSGWVELGKMAGFGVVQLLPGLVDGLRLNSAIVLPLSMEAYAAYALRCWLGSSGLSERTVKFARRSAISSLVIGALAQVAYHLMAAAGLTRAPWWITMLVACVPVVVLGLASALARLVSSDLQQASSAGGGR